MAGGRPKLVHRPELVTRSDGRYEIRCEDCRVRTDEPVPIGIGLPVSSRVLAVEMLRNHVGPAARRTASQLLPAPPPPLATPVTTTTATTATTATNSAGPDRPRKDRPVRRTA